MFLLGLWSLASGPWTAQSATITGTLHDLSLQPLDTKLVFTPTNAVLVTASGLSAGPPRVIDITNGAFSLVLDAGDYTVSLPLVPTRRPFVISVFDTNGTLDITSLLSAPQTYTYTNNLNYAVKATPSDTAPNILAAKLDVTSPLTKTTNSMGGAATIVLGLDPNASGTAGCPWTVSEADTNIIQFGDFITVSRGGLISAPNISLGGGALYTDPDFGWLHGSFEGAFTGDGSALTDVTASGGQDGLTTNVLCGARTLIFTRGILTGVQ